ncbi:hypothetical protein PR001_g30254 [Phytophthora rubi]|uniref:Uncharacterized protein n=1 Tax=Phytophthora rubi TaxID=129364 RepID=A0A6A3GUX3_9STRA|nr:hypothetical protein PR001_g30254 [Phytophthora rubi]
MQQLVRLGRLGYVKLPGTLTAQLLELLDREVVTPAQQDQDVDDNGGGVFGFEKIFLNADVLDKYRRQAPVPHKGLQRSCGIYSRPTSPGQFQGSGVS